MTIDNADAIEQSSIVLAREVEKLEELGLTFAASVVRIALLDLQMRLHGVSLKELDLLCEAAVKAGKMQADTNCSPEESGEKR